MGNGTTCLLLTIVAQKFMRGRGWGRRGQESRIAVASLFTDTTEDIPFHTTSEIAVRKQN